MYSNCCCSCSFEAEIIKIGQSSHKIYSNNILHFQESTSILNARTKKKSGILLNAPRKLISFNKLVCWIVFNTYFSMALCFESIGWIFYTTTSHIRVVVILNWFLKISTEISTEIYLPNPPSVARCDTRIIFKPSKVGWNSDFSFFLNGYSSKAKAPNLPYYLLVSERRQKDPSITQLDLPISLPKMITVTLSSKLMYLLRIQITKIKIFIAGIIYFYQGFNYLLSLFEAGIVCDWYYSLLI